MAKRQTYARRQKIMRLLHKETFVHTGDLAQKLGVSAVTLRADLRILEDQGFLMRRNGGASIITSFFHPIVRLRSFSDNHVKEREAIAEAASAFIKDGDKIILDSGLTTFHLSKKLAPLNDLTIMTKGLETAFHLVAQPYLKNIYVAGGRINSNTLSIEGSLDVSYLYDLHEYFDTFFLGVVGVDKTNGFMTNNAKGAILNATFCKMARKIIVLCPSYKIGRSHSFKIISWDKITTFITDTKAPPDFLERVKQAGIQLIVVPPKKLKAGRLKT